LATLALPEQLQPVIFNLVAALSPDRGDQWLHALAIPAEEFHSPTALADQQMLVTLASGNESLAA